jgi:hypothetical protein
MQLVMGEHGYINKQFGIDARLVHHSPENEKP